jgi:SMI1-KNR4 cell-wall
MNPADTKALEEVMQRLRNVATCECACSEDDIRLAERELGVHFPDSYRLFVSHLGAAFGKGGELYGLSPGYSSGEGKAGVVACTLEERTRAKGLPSDCIAIGDLGNGDVYVMRCGNLSDPPVDIMTIRGDLDTTDGWRSLRDFIVDEFRLGGPFVRGGVDHVGTP